jgi:hypothetical protein
VGFRKANTGGSDPHYVIEEVNGIRTVVVTGPWSLDAEQVLLRGKAEALVLNYARGFEGDLERGELEFLTEHLGIRRLALLDRGIPDVSPIYRLRHTLDDLSIQAAPNATLDLEQLPGLQKIAGEWALIGPTLGALRHLREVSTWSYGESDLSAFEPHTNLVRVTVKDAPRLESLHGLASHDALRRLEIRGARRLGDISVLTDTEASLEELILEGCRAIESLAPIDGFRQLRDLEIGECGDLPSANELARLLSLEVLSAWGSTCFLDGDISILTRLPALKELRMRNRRHYHPAVKDIPAARF